MPIPIGTASLTLIEVAAALRAARQPPILARMSTLHRDLPAIPLIDVADGGPLALLAAERPRAEALLAAGRRRYGRMALALGDRVSWRWLERSENPFRDEIAAIADQIGDAGAAMLNLSFEWSCTSGAAPDLHQQGNRLLRVLDWPLDGLGRHVVVAKNASVAGSWYNITWPGAVGVLTAIAPGRFAAAINQAPMTRRGLGLAGDWAVNRMRVWQSMSLPPAHLLRLVFERATSFAEAKRVLMETPLVLPALFVLSGTHPDEGALIERLENEAILHEGAVACANYWRNPLWGGRARGRNNVARRAAMATIFHQASNGLDRGFDWLVAPMLNPKTRLAVSAHAASGCFQVQGFEKQAPATTIFAHRPADEPRPARGA
jgi:hypothetical protein